MYDKKIACFFLLFFSLVNCSNFEKTDDKSATGPHGGQLKNGEFFNVEMVPGKKGIMFYAYDKNNRPLADSEIDITGKYGASGSKDEYSLLIREEEDHFLGLLSPERPMTDDLKVKAQVSSNRRKENFGFLIE